MASPTEMRKLQHIQHALQDGQISTRNPDYSFDYEPLLSAHPNKKYDSFTFLGKTFNAPIWISSMTGGTKQALLINQRLAKACRHFQLGMGVGSCRILLDDHKSLDHFNLRPILGDKVCFYLNLGIAQIEQLHLQNNFKKIDILIDQLQADGLIIHLNPLQELLQKEGDQIKEIPAQTLERFLEKRKYPVIVKEVGQGIGPRSLKKLLSLPLEAIEFAAWGGTNFSQIELARNQEKQSIEEFKNIGHSAYEMVLNVNKILTQLADTAQCKQFIISGGIKSFLQGYYLISQCQGKAIYGQAHAFLKKALISEEELFEFIENQIKGLQAAKRFLVPKEIEQ